MAKYRKKPVVIEAMRVCELNHLAANDFWKLPTWMIAAYDRGEVLFLNHPIRIDIKTLEGTMTGNVDDLIICGVKGELSPCKPDVFAQTYELVEDTEESAG